jgi:tetratricopeptide (TPR) repeat protein
VKRLVALVVLVAGIGACNSSDTPELLGDQAYGAGRYAEALRQYQAAAPHASGSRIWAKLGAAALHADDLHAASEAYRRLGAEDPTRSSEAAEGLEAVARRAEQAGDVDVLHQAILGLRAVAPERPSAPFALALARRTAVSGAEAATLLPAALAAAPDAAVFDSLLAAYGAALQETGACDQAAPTFRATMRRTRDPGLRQRAGTGLANCALNLGITALGAHRLEDAGRWFYQAAQVDSTTWTGRRALIGLGDARVGQGDILGAVIAFQQALGSGAQPDSLGQIAAERLRTLGAPMPAPAPADPSNRRTP